MGKSFFVCINLFDIKTNDYIYNRSNAETYESDLVTEITKRIHDSQSKGLVVSPVSIVSAVILYGRATHGVCIGKIKELMEWMRYEIKRNGYYVDWQGKLISVTL